MRRANEAFSSTIKNNIIVDLSGVCPAVCFVFVVVVFCLFCCCFGLCFVASDILTTICHLAIVNVCVIIILSIGNTQISTLLLCFLYLFVELMIIMNE